VARRLRGPTGDSSFLTWHGRGVFYRISPWNFPLAIFIGQSWGGAGTLRRSRAALIRSNRGYPVRTFESFERALVQGAHGLQRITRRGRETPKVLFAGNAKRNTSKSDRRYRGDSRALPGLRTSRRFPRARVGGVVDRAWTHGRLGEV